MATANKEIINLSLKYFISKIRLRGKTADSINQPYTAKKILIFSPQKLHEKLWIHPVFEFYYNQMYFKESLLLAIMMGFDKKVNLKAHTIS